MKLEVLHVAGCPNLPLMLQRLAEATALPVTTRLIESDADAAEYGMAGSPTLLIDGVDPFAAGGDRGLSCRLYRGPDGRIAGAPSVVQLRDAITAAGQPAEPGSVLSGWRTRAVPLDPVQRAVHQAILRSFASTGRAPRTSDLEAVTEGSGRSATEALSALHDVDAIRLDADGVISVAYPFSSTPTRHRVRIGDLGPAGVDVHAMCAIDALGISAMVGQDTRIESVDVTTGQPVTITTSRGRTDWEPTGAVVFVGAGSGGGPSADCCCDYLNFFADLDTARDWSMAHPHVPGQILDQAAAEGLGIRLFGHLLADTLTLTSAAENAIKPG